MDPSSRAGEQILVIEDNKTNRELMIYLLNTFGYSTCEAANGRLGLEMARAKLPRLVVCDIQVPDVDGYGVIRELKLDENLRDIPVVAVTALAMVGDRDRILAAGFDGYVAKPISPETFVYQLERFLPPEKRAMARDVVTPPASSSSKSRTRKSAKSRGTVAVVDDVPANLEFARSTLQPCGYTVFTAGNVEMVLALMRKTKPNLVLSDLHMQPHSGLDLLDQMKTDPVLKWVPVIIISNTGNGPYAEADCLNRGAAAFVRRPIEPEMLLARIERVLGRSVIAVSDSR